RAVSEPEEDSRRRGAQVVLCERLSVHGDKVERTAKRFFRRLLVAEKIEPRRADNDDDKGDDEDGQEFFHVQSALNFRTRLVAPLNNLSFLYALQNRRYSRILPS